MTPAGIETATFRCVAQHLTHCATAVPPIEIYVKYKNWMTLSGCVLLNGIQFLIYFTYKKLKYSRSRPGVAQRVGSGTVLLFHDRGTRRG